MADSDPLRAIEDERAQKDIGVFAYRVYVGAKEDGATEFEAYMIVCAWFVGSFHPKPDNEDEDDERRNDQS